MEQALQHKTALVGGASKGIGHAAAMALAQQGARIVALARTERLLQELMAQLPGQGHAYIIANAQTPAALGQAVNQWVQANGPIHVWVNNTGGPAPGPLAQAQPQVLANAFDMHLVAAQYVLQALLPGMQQEGFGRIINIISTSVKAPIPGLGVSNTIRGAMASWAKTLATELGPHGITVNNILPGYTDTERLQSLLQNKAQQAGTSPEQVSTQMQAQIPAQRFGLPQETAAAITFLASPAAAYISGINLPVDGGRLPNL